MKRLFLCGVLACVLFVGSFVSAPAAAAADVELPEDVCAVVEARSIDDLIAGLDEFSAGLSGPPIGDVPPMGQKLAEGLNELGPGVVDTRSPARVLVLDPPMHMSPVFVFRATDPEKFFTQFQDSLQQTQGDVRIYNFPGPFRSMAAQGNHVVVSAAPQAVQRGMQLVRSRAATGKPMLPEGQVVLCARLKKLMEGLKRTGMNPLDTARQAIVAAQQHSQDMPPETSAILMAELDAVESLALQTEMATWTVSFDRDQVAVDGKVEASMGSKMADYFKDHPRGTLRTLKYIPAGSIAGYAGKHGGYEELMDWYTEMFRKMAAAGGGDTRLVDKWDDIVTKTIELYGDEICAAVQPADEGGFQFTEVIEIEDPSAFKKLMPEFTDAMKVFTEMPQTSGMKMDFQVDEKATTYKGQDVMEWRMAWSFDESVASKSPQQQQMVETQRKIFETLFGGPELVMHSAFKGNDMLITGGKGSLDLLKKMMDGRITPVTESAMWKEHMGEDAAQHTGLIYVSPTDLSKWLYDMLSRGHEGEVSPPEFPDSPPMVMTVDVSGRTMECNTRVPTAGIRAMAAFIMVSPPVRQARSAAQRAACLSHLKQIGMAVTLYRQDNDQEMPASLAEIVPDYLSSADVLVCPADQDPMKLGEDMKTSYHYVGRLGKAARATNASRIIIAYEKPGSHLDRTNALFMDAHAESMTEQQLRDRLDSSLQAMRDSTAWNDLSNKRKSEIKAFHNLGK